MKTKYEMKNESTNGITKNKPETRKKIQELNNAVMTYFKWDECLNTNLCKFIYDRIVIPIRDPIDGSLTRIIIFEDFNTK